MSRVKLGDVAFERKETLKNGNNQVTVGLEHLIPEEIELTQWDEGAENTFTKAFHKGDILFGRRRAYLKKAAVASLDGICSGDITVISANEEKISPRLLPFIIQNDAFFDFAVEKSAGSLSPRVKWQHLKEYEFELPDMGKQQELAELLWSMNATKMAYKKLLEKTDELVKSQFIEMFGDVVNNTRHWPECSLGDKAEIGSSKRIFAREYVASGVPFYRSKEIIELGKGLSPSVELYITKERYEEIRKKYGVPQVGDILMTAVGTIGKFWTVQSEQPFYYKDGNLVYIRPFNVNTTYFQSLLEMLIEDYKRDAANGSAYAALPIEKLKAMKIVDPPRLLQDQIERLLRQSDKSKFELEQSIVELTATYKKIISENLG